jgi:hypothetical protein
MTDGPCQACEQTRRELHAVQQRLGLLVQGLAAVLALLGAEQTEPTMPKRRVLAVVHHRLDHLMSQTNGRTRR